MSKLLDFFNFSSADTSDKNEGQDHRFTSQTPRSFGLCINESEMTHQKMVGSGANDNLATVNLGDVLSCAPREVATIKPTDSFNVICGTSSQQPPLNDSTCFNVHNQDDSISSSYSFLEYTLITSTNLTSENGLSRKSQLMDLNYKLVSDCDLIPQSQEAFPPSSPTSSIMEQSKAIGDTNTLNEILCNESETVDNVGSKKSPSSKPPICIFQNSLSTRLKLLISHEHFVTFKFIRLKTKYKKYIRQFKLDAPTNFRFPPPFTLEFFNLRNTRYHTIHHLKQNHGFRQNKDEDNDPTSLEGKAYRLNTVKLAKILDLQNYRYELTKEVELNVLEIFKNYCKFDLGFQTWIRDTPVTKRSNFINQLYLLTYYFYPELSKGHLEAIIRKGIYTMMQYRLRNSRTRKKITTGGKK
jgi:hypothetical protein